MATTTIPEPAAGAPVAQAVKFPLMTLLASMLAMLLLLAAAVGGAAWWLYKSGRLAGLLSAAPVSTAPAKAVEVAAETHNVVLEPLLVNLADADGHGYLRVSIVLAEAEAKDDKKAAKEKEGKPSPGADAAVRDVLLSVLSRKTSDDLLKPDGKDELKKELKEAVKKDAPEAHVENMYFTDFLVQR